MRAFFDLQGREVALGRCLGRGGEGAVYAVPRRPGLAAKIYAQRPGDDTIRKLGAMIALGRPDLGQVAAWPLALLIDGRGGTVVGFVMPRVEGCRPIHVLHNPMTRRAAFPEATWAFLVRAARSLASAFDAVHSRGHVIGDVNEGNAVVSREAAVHLIDCDSFQVAHDGRTWPCRVGVPLFTPPELQGRGFEGVVRTADHDRFGLAVLVFQLLFMGRHPYAGRHPTREIAVETAIRQGLFAFGWEAARLGWLPPPFTLRLGDVPAGVSGLFEKAFARGAATGLARPSAGEWVAALDELEARIASCDCNPRHLHARPSGGCPWCRIEAEGGPSFFHAVVAGGDGVNLAACRRASEAVPSPGPAVPPAAPAFPGIVGRPLPPEVERERRRRTVTAAVLAAFAIGAVASGEASGLLPLLLLWVLRPGEALSIERQARRRAVEECRAELGRLQARYRLEAGDRPFRRTLEKLGAAQAVLDEAPRVEEAERRELVEVARRERLRSHLTTHRLVDAPVPLLGQADLERLLRHGIATAKDVTPETLSRRPEAHGPWVAVGPDLERALLAWRADVERAFVFDPRADVGTREARELEERQRKRREAAWTVLRSGAAALRHCHDAILERRRAMEPSFAELHRRLAQLEADLKRAG